MVGVEDQEDLTGGATERMVDVARLGVLVGCPRNVSGTETGRQIPHLRPATVIEDPGPVGVPEPVAADQGGRQDLRCFVIGTDEHVHGRTPADGGTFRPGDPPGEEGERGKCQPSDHLAGVEHAEQPRLGTVPGERRPPAEIGDAPQESDPGGHPRHPVGSLRGEPSNAPHHVPWIGMGSRSLDDGDERPVPVSAERRRDR